MSSYSLDEFFAACGSAGPLRLTVDDDQRTEDYVLPQPFAVAGSDARADVRRPGGPAGRRAAYLQLLDGRLLCLNLTDPRTGNFPPHQWLDPGQTWSAGPMPLRLTEPPAGPPDGCLVRHGDLPPAAVEITGGSGGPCRYRIKAPIVLIGKSPQCQVKLRDASVSRFHCALVSTRAGLWAVDLLGRGGIAINGAAARAARLDDGDLLRVGGFAFRPLIGAPRELAPRPPGPRPVPATAPGPIAVPAFSADQFGKDLGPLVSLVAVLHQQMSEQLRLTIGELVGSFRRMHEDQMRMVWDELAQIRRLNDEVAALKTQTVPRAAEMPPPSPRVADLPRQPAPVTAAPRPLSQPATSPAPATATPTPRPAGPPPDPAVEDQVHTWVSRRIAEVQREREGRWQRVLNFLTGSSA